MAEIGSEARRSPRPGDVTGGEFIIRRYFGWVLYYV